MQLFAESVGIDIGLKSFIATHDGTVIDVQRICRAMDKMHGLAQRTYKNARLKAIHAGIAARRKSFIIS
ncbi:hypothetical protein RY831_04680 [Noviherbaspirillum sp. CPCC 100848]|uniref:Transposase n=1 Tax=Noviherbaspirillum album TaxID=3080276 RepID=A0ABU6J490_9BURK|nr:hypothetical protein [Noviherbaspirillum sp. CPCC 100848]MEC4718429.1 hypothetical protein [Noviherbaspirillum sp. CPCC 100848]